MYDGKDPHRHITRIVTDEHLVNLQDSAELLIECFSGNVSKIQIDLVLAVYSVTVETNLKDLTRGDVARYEVAVSRILLFQKIPSLRFGNRRRRTGISFRARDPHATTLATC